MDFFPGKTPRQTAEWTPAVRVIFWFLCFLTANFISSRAEIYRPPEISEDYEIRYIKAGDREKINMLLKLADYWSAHAPLKSIDYLKEAVSLARKLNLKEEEANILYRIGDLYDGLRNDSLALEYYQQALKAFSLMHVETKEQGKKVKMFGLIAGGLLIPALIVFFFRYYNQYRTFRNELRKSEERQKNLQFETQLKVFQSKINPHFLFNALDSLNDLQKDNGGGSKTVVAWLADLYRKVFRATETPITSLQNELDIVRDYLDIEKTILNSRLDYTISIREDLLRFKMMPLMILPLIENAVMHGLKKTGKGGRIRIEVLKENGFLSITIADDGIGFDPTAIDSGFGLYSVQQRLQLFYEGKARFHIESSAGCGTTIRMEVPDA